MLSILLTLITYISVALGSGVLIYFPVFGVVPNLVLLVVVALAVSPEDDAYILPAVLGGLLIDVTAGLPIGATGFSMLVCGFVIVQLSRYVVSSSGSLRWPLAAAAGSVFVQPVIAWAWVYGLSVISSKVVPMPFPRVLPTLVLTLVSTVLFFFVYAAVQFVRNYAESYASRKYFTPHRL